MALSKEEREQYLAEPHIAALSVSAGDKRGPLTVPIWYLHTGHGSRKHRPIETDGEFTLMAERREHIEAVAIFMKPQHWISADLGSM